MIAGASRRDVLKALSGITTFGPTPNAAAKVGGDQTTDIGGWPMFGHDAANTGHAPDERGPADSIKLMWRYETGADIFSSPAVVNGAVYFGSVDRGVYALDAADGSELWRFETDDGVYSSPAVVDDTVYIGGTDSNAYALDANDGTELWRFPTGEFVRSSMVVVKDTLYVGSWDNNIYAVDTSNGTEQWRFETGSRVYSGPAVANDTVYIGSRDNNLYALDADTGTEQWHFETGDIVFSEPTVSNGTVFFGSFDSNVYAVDADEGFKRWHFQTGAGVNTSPAVVDGTVCVGGWDNNIYALDANDGAELWRFRTGDRIISSPMIVGETVYTGSDDSHLYALDIRTGSEKWHFQTSGEIYSSPAVVDGILYIGSADGGLYALTQEETAVSSSTPVNSTPSSTPTDTTPSSTPTEVAGGGDTSSKGEGGIPWVVGGGIVETILLGGLAGGYKVLASEEPADDTGSVPGSTVNGSESARNSSRRQSGDEPANRQLSDWFTTPSTNVVPGAPDLSLAYDDLDRCNLIGRGGNADVYRATAAIDTATHELAVKEPRLEGTLDAQVAEEFRAEAETWARLDNHDYVVDVVDYGNDPVPWIAMEYMDGGALDERLNDLAFPQALWTGIAMCEALAHAHTRGIAHLDLKPRNILFRTVENAWDVPKVGDWGLAKLLLDHSKTIKGLTPQYAAPEQFDDENVADHQTDIYQAGAVVYELLTGEPPFKGDIANILNDVLNEDPTPPTALNPDLPNALDDVLLRALAKQKADRYEHIIYFRDTLKEADPNQ